MNAVYDPADETGVGPFLTEHDMVAFSEPDHAAAAARASLTDQGSGQWRTDDQ